MPILTCNSIPLSYSHLSVFLVTLSSPFPRLVPISHYYTFPLNFALSLLSDLHHGLVTALTGGATFLLNATALGRHTFPFFLEKSALRVASQVQSRMVAVRRSQTGRYQVWYRLRLILSHLCSRVYLVSSPSS